MLGVVTNAGAAAGAQYSSLQIYRMSLQLSTRHLVSFTQTTCRNDVDSRKKRFLFFTPAKMFWPDA
jgi:hypothetical protein